ncbi:MAG TPA: AgmX/PglI C-terminal domain-containing protein [Polyangiaceae bacterium]
MKRALVWVVGGGMLLGACGGEPPPKAPEPAPEPVRATRPAAPMKSSQELGQIDEGATNKTFESLQGKLLDCQKQGMQRVEYLSGDVRFFLRIAQDGSVRWAYLEDSTLGDRATEKCMVDVVTAARWPQPDGGEAEVQKGLSFDSGDARPPVAWRSEKVADALSKQADDALHCKGGTSGTFKVTAYVEPSNGHKGKGGKVLSVGVASPNKDGDTKADCIADAVKDWKLPSPGGYAAKVTFNL